MSTEAPRRVLSEPMRCPSCGSRLVEVERSEILIDACPECRGVWLDRGELDKILARERAAIAADPDEDFFAEVEGRKGQRQGGGAGQGPQDQQGRKKKSRFGIFEEFLDF
jgi:uncharacterized protein